MQTAIGLVIGEICKNCNVAQDWPELMPRLVAVVADSGDAQSGVLQRGALRVLCLLVEDLDSSTVVHLSLAVLPQLVASIMNNSLDQESTYQALRILHETIDAVEISYRTSQDAKVLLQQQMGSWLEACRVVLARVQDMGNLPTVHLALEVVTSLIPLIGKGEANVHGVLAGVWSCNGVVREAYMKSCVLGMCEEPEVASGAIMERTTLSDVACQLLELFAAIVSSPKLKKACEPSLVGIMTDTVQTYMMICQEEVDEWTEDCNTYLRGGEDWWGCRCLGGLLIDSILETYGSKGAEAFASSMKLCVEAAESAVAKQDVVFWRIMEATLLALGDAADCSRVRKLASGGPAAEVLDPNRLLPVLLGNSNYNSMSTPLLLARIYSYAGKYSGERLLSDQTGALVLRCMGESIATPNIPAAVYGGIFQGLTSIVNAADAVPSDVSNHFMAGLALLLATASEDTLHLLLESIHVLIRKDPSCVVTWASSVAPVAVKAWVDNYNDPLLGEDAFALMRSLSRAPGGMDQMMASAIPTIKSILQTANSANSAPAFLVSSCFDLLTEITGPAGAEAARQVFVEFVPMCLSLLQSNTGADEEVMASISAFMRTSLQLGVWYETSVDACVGTYVQVVQYLLRPETPDRGAQHVGGIIMALLPHLSQDATAIPAILRLVASKLSLAEDPALVQSLVGVIASFARIDTSQMIEALGAPLFQATMDKWCERHIEIRTPYDIKRSVVALAAVLACPNPIIDDLVVRGQRTDTGPAIRTRSKAVTLKEEWSLIGLRQKILLLLVDSYIETRVAGADEEDEGEWEGDDDWEEEGDEEGSVEEGIDPRPQSAYSSSYSMYGEYLGGEEDELEVEEFVDYLELKRRETDELNGLDLEAYCAGVLRNSAQSLQLLPLTATQKDFLSSLA